MLSVILYFKTEDRLFQSIIIPEIGYFYRAIGLEVTFGTTQQNHKTQVSSSVSRLMGGVDNRVACMFLIDSLSLTH